MLVKEIELKYRVQDKAALDAVIAVVDPNQSALKMLLEQENYFFDTPDWALKNKKLALRLRRQNDDFMMTAKGNAKKDDNGSKNLSVHYEHDAPVPNSAAEAMLAGELSPLGYFASTPAPFDKEAEETRCHLAALMADVVKGQRLQLVGSFQNVRTTLPLYIDGEELLLELDETTFNGNIHEFEIELELPAEFEVAKAETLLDEICSRANVQAQPSRGKSERFFEYLQKTG